MSSSFSVFGNTPIREYYTEKSAKKYANTHTYDGGKQFVVKKLEKSVFDMYHKGPVWGIFAQVGE